ncbi:amine oxidase, partial [Candidatus Shapirobacteria bacterium CG10_big_fil_rev_8_21_14_0_10_38_14]
KFFKTKLPKMFGAISLILELKEKFFADGTYWLNINNANFPFVAVVEHTNFTNPKHYANHHLLYVGGYY